MMIFDFKITQNVEPLWFVYLRLNKREMINLKPLLQGYVA